MSIQKIKNQNGFSHLLGLLAVLVLAAIGGTFYLVQHRTSSQSNQPVSASNVANVKATEAATAAATAPLSFPAKATGAPSGSSNAQSANPLSCSVEDIAKPGFGEVVNPKITIVSNGTTTANIKITAVVQAAGTNDTKTMSYAKLYGSTVITVLSFTTPYATANDAYGQYTVSLNGTASCSDLFPLPIATPATDSQLSCEVQGIWEKPDYGTVMTPVVSISNGNSQAVLGSMPVDATLSMGKGTVTYHETYAKFINSGTITMPSFTVNASQSANGLVGEYAVSIYGHPLCSAAFPLPYSTAAKG